MLCVRNVPSLYVFLHFHICGKRNGFLIYVGLFVACTFHSSAIITLALPFLMMISYISNDKKRNLLISFLFLMMCTVTMAFLDSFGYDRRSGIV